MATRFLWRAPAYQRARNRGLLLEALESGLRVLPLAPDLALVESSQLNGSYYVVTTVAAGATVGYICTCDWGSKQQSAGAGPWCIGAELLPCKHQLLVVWYGLPALQQARLRRADPTLAAALAAGAAAQATRTAAAGPAGGRRAA